MIEITCEFFGWKVQRKLYPEIYSLSGGIPRLIKHICKLISEEKIKVDNLDKFEEDPAILFQLNYLVNLLVSVESKYLFRLGLTDENGKVKSALLERYLKKYRSLLVTKFFPRLTILESKVVSYLYENEGEILTLDKISELLKMTDDNYSLWAIYKVISRIKPKIKSNFKITNLKGRGYILEKPILKN